MQQAILRPSMWSYSGPRVAVKKLRPTGNQHQRIRVAAVSIDPMRVIAEATDLGFSL